jgi:hypothetical protein
VVLDLSAVYHSPALGVLMACAAAWLQNAVRAQDHHRIIVVVDEAWAILSNPRIQAVAAEDGPCLVAGPSLFVQGDHLYDERDMGNISVRVADDHRVETHLVEVDRQGERERVVVADPVVHMHPPGDLEGEVLMDHHRQLVDAVDVDAQIECSSIFVGCHLDDESQGQ